MAYFILDSAPEILVDDPTENQTISLSELFAIDVKGDTVNEELEFEQGKLQLTHLRRYSSAPSEHVIHLCADQREVCQLRLATEIKALSNRLVDGKGSYFYACYVRGRLLDKLVNWQRTGFNFAQEGELQLGGQLTLHDLIKIIVSSVERFLEDDLHELRQSIKNKISSLVRGKYPEYRSVLPRIEPYLKSFPSDPDDDEILLTLNEAQLREDLATRDEVKTILEVKKSVTDDESYTAQVEAYMQRVQDSAKARLSQYVIHRKAILQLFRQRLESDENEKYEREEKIHQVIFPTKATSDDTDWALHNLWIIDEKLSFHHYLASDTRLGSERVAAVRPDLIVYEKPAAFTDQEHIPYSSVKVIEFKRPMRDAYHNDNPIYQVQSYVQLIQEGKAMTNTSRPIAVSSTTPFECYIICDFTPQLHNIAIQHNYTATSDKQEYFYYNANLKAYIEFISFDKLIQDAEQRNHVLFKQLGLLPQR